MRRGYQPWEERHLFAQRGINHEKRRGLFAQKGYQPWEEGGLFAQRFPS